MSVYLSYLELYCYVRIPILSEAILLCPDTYHIWSYVAMSGYPSYLELCCYVQIPLLYGAKLLCPDTPPI